MISKKDKERNDKFPTKTNTNHKKGWELLATYNNDYIHPAKIHPKDHVYLLHSGVYACKLDYL